MVMNAPTATAPATVKTATVAAPKADPMSDNGDPEIEKSRVARLLDIQKQKADVAGQAEYQVMLALWNLRGSYRLEDMVAWTGWSKQTIYNKWKKHGLEITDA